MPEYIITASAMARGKRGFSDDPGPVQFLEVLDDAPSAAPAHAIKRADRVRKVSDLAGRRKDATGVVRATFWFSSKYEINVLLLAHSTGAYVVREAFDDADDRRRIAAINGTVSQLVLIAGDVPRRLSPPAIRRASRRIITASALPTTPIPSTRFCRFLMPSVRGAPPVSVASGCRSRLQRKPSTSIAVSITCARSSRGRRTILSVTHHIPGTLAARCLPRTWHIPSMATWTARQSA